MSKKVLSVLLAVAMLVTMLCVAGVSAGASEAKEMNGGTIYFEVPEDWGELTPTTAIYAHVWVNGGEEMAVWQTKAEKMTLVEGRTYSFTFKKSPAQPGSDDWNMIVFSKSDGPQTYDTTMSLSCLGDTAYVTDEMLENPIDSNKSVPAARWKNNKDQGPHLQISSIGNIVGNVIIPGETIDSIIEAFATNPKYEAIATEEKIKQLREDLKPYFEDEPGSDPTSGPTSGPTDEPTTAPTDKPTTPPTTDPTDPVTDPPTVAPTDPTSSNESTTDAYGRERGIPIPDGVQMPARVMNNNGQPGDEAHPDWDGYYRIYYFRAPEKWLENAQYKDEGFEIGFYWFAGMENNGSWPGVAATKLNVEGYEDVYYAIAPSYANKIIWNNGINGGLETDKNFDPAKKAAAMQTVDINVEDGMFNQLKIDDLCGNIFELDGKTKPEKNGLTGELQTLYTGDWSYFNPLTGEQTTDPLMDDKGNPILDENGNVMNPYFDMDYDYVRPGKPIEEPSSSTLPTETPTNGNGSGKAPGTVNTAQDVASFFMLATILLAAACAVVIARRKRAQG